MSLKKGILKSFNAASYLATVQLGGSPKSYLQEVAVARNLPSAEMISGRQVVLACLAENSPREMVVLAVYTA